jgi:UDP-N-acetylmuramate--alanine ligase
MVAAVLAGGGLDPTVVVGGRVDAMGSNARLGKSQFLVAETDESDRSFLKLSPILAVVTNLDREHMDCYRDMADVEQAFIDFVDRVPFYGMVVLCNDDERLRSLLPRLARRAATYGLRSDSDFHITPSQVECASPQRHYSHFAVDYRGKSLGQFHLQVPGRHNILNATAAIAVGIGLDIAPDHIRQALERFRGVDRRFQLKGTANGVSVIDDYGHHPTEIRATLAAARECGFEHIHVVFQPHRYTRTQDLLDQFAGAFSDADRVLVLDIYAAGEPMIPGVTSKRVAEAIGNLGGKDASYVSSFSEAARQAASVAESGDLVLTLGAGNVSQLGPEILKELRNRVTAVIG